MNSKAAEQDRDCAPIFRQCMLVEFRRQYPDKIRKGFVILVNQCKPYPSCLHEVYNVYSLAKHAAVPDECHNIIRFCFSMRWPP